MPDTTEDPALVAEWAAWKPGQPVPDRADRLAKLEAISDDARDRIAEDPAFLARLATALDNFTPDDTPCGDPFCLHTRDDHDPDDGTCWGGVGLDHPADAPQCPCPGFRDPQDDAREQGQRWADQDRDER